MTRMQFSVDPVVPAAEPRTTVTLGGALEAWFSEPMMACSHPPETRVLGELSINPLVEAVHIAFAEHRPLVLSPEVVWLTMAHGFAQHLRLNAEALRKRLVRHEGKKTLCLEVMQPPQPEEWPALIGRLGDLMAEEIGHGMRHLFQCDFSTSTPTDRVVSDIMMMDAHVQYFDIIIACVCGIPTVTLLGTPDDWRTIRARVDVMAEYDLDWWTRRLIPICDALVRTAEGEVDVRFWQELYKPEAVYGGEVVTGWLGHLFPYIGKEPTADSRNPMLEVEFPVVVGADQYHRQNNAVAPGLFPIGLSKVTVQGQDTGWDGVELVGGLLGVQQGDDLALQPLVGWVVVERSERAVLLNTVAGSTRPLRDGEAQPRLPSLPLAGAEAWRAPGFIRELADRLGGTVIDRGVRWYPRGPQQITAVQALTVEGMSAESALTEGWALMDFGQGRFLVAIAVSLDFDEATLTRSGWTWWFLEGVVAETPDWDRAVIPHTPETPIVAESIEELFQLLDAHDGEVWWDAPDYTPRHRLATVLDADRRFEEVSRRVWAAWREALRREHS